jgi:predicted ribosomally synthesized peptide with SipW-like signal peptide
MAAIACLGLLYTSFAYFEDTEDSIENTFQAGTWMVDVDGGGSSASHVFQGLGEGDSGTKTWSVTNTGSVSAYVDLNISVAESGTGDLGDFLTAYLYVSGGDDIYGPDAVNGMAGSYDLDLPLESGESVDITLDWYVSDGYYPDENDQVVLTINFDIQPAP